MTTVGEPASGCSSSKLTVDVVGSLGVAGGNACSIITTPRVQATSKLFYTLFADVMNFAYRELMDVKHLGLYAYENGFEILRHGRIKAHNGLITRAR